MTRLFRELRSFCSLLTAHCSLLTAHCSLLTAHSLAHPRICSNQQRQTQEEHRANLVNLHQLIEQQVENDDNKRQCRSQHHTPHLGVLGLVVEALGREQSHCQQGGEQQKAGQALLGQLQQEVVVGGRLLGVFAHVGAEALHRIALVLGV